MVHFTPMAKNRAVVRASRSSGNRRTEVQMNESGAIYKDWGGRMPVALTMPNTYYVGMSSLALQLLYAAFNAEDDVVCERIFWEKGAAQSGKPLGSLESSAPPADFCALGLHHFVGDGLFQCGRIAAPGRHSAARGRPRRNRRSGTGRHGRC